MVASSSSGRIHLAPETLLDAARTCPGAVTSSTTEKADDHDGCLCRGVVPDCDGFQLGGIADCLATAGETAAGVLGGPRPAGIPGAVGRSIEYDIPVDHCRRRGLWPLRQVGEPANWHRRGRDGHWRLCRWTDYRTMHGEACARHNVSF